MKKKDWLAFLLILASIAVVFFDLVTLQKAFLSGDHLEQQIPWARFYQESIQRGDLPWWTSQIQSGFPLLAEGQIGAFYPLNYLFFLSFPFWIAYNYGILFHYSLGALFFFLLLRSYKISRTASVFASLVYLYGSCQGGYFYYNYISQKVVIWLPLTLLLTDRLRQRKDLLSVVLLAAVFAAQIFGGYFQVAIYSISFSLLYFLVSAFKEPEKKVMGLYAASLALAVFFSAPQWLATYELGLQSSRAGAQEAIAYLGSMNPLGMLTLLYPAWDSVLGSDFYLGLLGVFFAAWSVRFVKGEKRNFYILALSVYLLLALGRFSPLYIALVKLTGFYAFRTPIKFLFFAAFSAAVLAGYGFDAYFKREVKEKDKKFSREMKIWYGFFGVAAVLPIILPLILHVSRTWGVRTLQRVVEKFIHGKPGHPYPLEYYLEKAASFYSDAIYVLSLKNPYTLKEWLVMIAAIGILVWLARSRTPGKFKKALCILFLFMDLTVYGFSSIRASLEPLERFYQKKDSLIAQKILEDTERFRVIDISQAASDNEILPLLPNKNMLYGISNAGVYSPLASRSYKTFGEGLFYINDSLSTSLASAEKVVENLKTLSFMNVKYLIATVPLTHERLLLIAQERRGDKDVYLYQNLDVKWRAFFLPGVTSLSSFEEIIPGQALPVTILQYEDREILMEFNAPVQGLLVLADRFDPHWKVQVNGKPAKIERAAGQFHAVGIREGIHRVKFQYDPGIAGKTAKFAFISFFLLAGLALYFSSLETREKTALFWAVIIFFWYLARAAAERIFNQSGLFL